MEDGGSLPRAPKAGKSTGIASSNPPTAAALPATRADAVEGAASLSPTAASGSDTDELAGGSGSGSSDIELEGFSALKAPHASEPTGTSREAAPSVVPLSGLGTGGHHQLGAGAENGGLSESATQSAPVTVRQTPASADTAPASSITDPLTARDTASQSAASQNAAPEAERTAGAKQHSEALKTTGREASVQLSPRELADLADPLADDGSLAVKATRTDARPAASPSLSKPLGDDLADDGLPAVKAARAETRPAASTDLSEQLASLGDPLAIPLPAPSAERSTPESSAAQSSPPPAAADLAGPAVSSCTLPDISAQAAAERLSDGNAFASAAVPGSAGPLFDSGAHEGARLADAPSSAAPEGESDASASGSPMSGGSAPFLGEQPPGAEAGSASGREAEIDAQMAALEADYSREAAQAAQALQVRAPSGLSHSVQASGDRDAMATLLCTKKRQFFIFSNSGRPIYTRHGDIHAAAGITSLLTGLLAYAESAVGEFPTVVRVGRHTLCARVRPSLPETQRSGDFKKSLLHNAPIVAVVASRAGEPPRVLKMQLELLHLQLLAWTSLQVEGTLTKRPNTDIDDLLIGTHATFEVLLKRFARSPDYFLAATEVVPLEEPLRRSATHALQQAVADSGALYGFVAAGHRLVAQAHHATRTRGALHPWDLLLLMNFVASNPSFRSQYAGQQVFVPMCCPSTAPDAFMHVYVHFPDAGSPLFIVLVGSQQADFYNLHTVRVPLMEALETCGAREAAEQVLSAPHGGRVVLTDLPLPEADRERLTALAWHVVLLDPSGAQFVASAPTAPIHGAALQKFALLDIMQLHSSMWAAARRHKGKEPMKFQWRATPRWVLVGMIDKRREVYAIMDPFVSKRAALSLLGHIVRFFSGPQFWLLPSK